MKQLEILDEKTILSMLITQIDMGIDMVIKDKNSSFKEEIISNVKEKTFKNALITNSEKKAYDVALKARDISNLEKLFKNFDDCYLKKTANKFIAYEGKVNSQILIIDGTPESDEDKEGRPLVGAKGELFEKMLKAINLKREDVFIVNSIPWRPPGNRYPTNEEINICRPFVFNLISLLEPKIILCMGEVATNQILDLNESITKSRGKWHLFKNNSFYKFKKSISKQEVLPTFNLSYLLKRPETKRQAWEDMKMLRDKIKETIEM